MIQSPREFGKLARSIVLVVLVTAHGAVAAGPAIGSGVEGFESAVRPFFKAHCIQCHGPDKSKGKITLHTLGGDLAAGQELERWESILEMLASGEMPPEDEPQPSDADRKAVASWIEAGLRDYVQQASRQAAAPTTRRLTNFEYQNTMRDLLGFELKLIDNLPEDPGKPYHFNNTAEYMLIGPEQMDRYAENARRAMGSAIVAPGEPQVHRTTRSWSAESPVDGLQNDEISVYGNRVNTAATGMGLEGWPETGEYRIRVKAAAILPPGYTDVPLRLLMGYGRRTAGGVQLVEPVGTVHLRNTVDDLQTFEFRGRIENHPVEPTKISKGRQLPPSMAITPQNLFDDGRLNDQLNRYSVPRVVVRSIEFEAPVTNVWPPEHHTRILFESSLRENDPDAYVREVLDRFMSRAFRRPATAEEVGRYLKIYRIFAEESETFEQAMRETLAMVLVSPKFLYHAEEADGGASRQYELASRLSYFLWGSMPDDELFELASRGELDEPAVIDAQVRRLLADDRSKDFVDNFTTQWLSIAKLHSVVINQQLFPRFLYTSTSRERSGTEIPNRPTIRDYLHAETVGFIGELIKRNASASNIIDSDFAYLNEALAAHYGIQGVSGMRLRPVPIKPENRIGGLLTQGSVLVANSTGSAPHPIYRAVWLREAILGDEVKAPPAEVPSLSDSTGDSADKAVLIKELLALHRTKESCNDCHVRLDPWGIPFERYNAIGRFQAMVPKDGVRVQPFSLRYFESYAAYVKYLDSINTVEVQADARVPHGPNVDGMRELKDYLLRYRTDEISENVIRRLLTYGIGRELTYRDLFAVERLVEQAKGNDYKLRDIIIAICQSNTFRDVSPKDN
ncbi:MAG: DUF1592 domain-containing protein [Pirellulales bacterium]